MYLRKMTLQGFKSFARKTVLEFGKGITVVVGPNGSGKSNVSDAIKWVLGEQSMKNLRSKKSEDVIFVGSGSKAKAGMAEVSLELDNKDKIVPIEYTDVDITRRVFRSGEGEYFLNNSKVRLLDITEILSKSGFGRSTYTVIGQGAIDRLITQTAQERLELFRDASGVKHYYFKKEQALKKFEESRENLLRVADILKELKPRLNNLEKQKKDAEQRKILSDELRDLQNKYYGSELKDFSGKIDEYDKKYNEITKETETIEKEVSTITKKLEERALRSDQNQEHEIEMKLEQTEKELQGLQDYLLEYVRKNALIVEKQKFYKDNLADFKKELNETIKKIEEKESEIENIKKEKIKLESELEKFVSLLNGLDEKGEKKSLEPKEIISKAKDSLNKILKTIGNNFDNIEKLKSDIQDLINFLEEQEKAGSTDIFAKRLEISKNVEKIRFEISSNNEKINNNLEILNIYKNKENDLLDRVHESKELEDKKPEEKERQQIEGKINQLRQQKEEQKKELDSLKEKNRSLEGEFFEVEKSYRGKQDIIAQYKEELTRVEIELARLRTKEEDVKSEVIENLGTDKGLEYISISSDQKPFFFSKMTELRRKLETIGGVIRAEDNDEYKEVKERYDFLTSQSDDLRGALSLTKKVVLELEGKIHDQFREKFEKISSKFNYYFQKLFGGGTAKLILTEGEAEEAIVIDIQAVPPGKRVHTLNTLSGGEKALTSVALLFAIFSVNPTPFCVLDEVDAALDESNSILFANLLAELASKMQFIVITHNRETMKRAKVLYGVTMDETKISKILSLKLEEAEKYSE
ncbi:hypothetical protein COX95_02990 [bacterium CG_4_10_14_0_2_um_filter_33_32]|nr:MAG: hypothetical protein COY76_01060 [bacterium CG_4_10_14_0_8_um_filter_33_57]PIZ85743.1 MAG: hypothetical protein COX95_02990 [bacterium CG_4_10_14_0_2_um_filter_33_32]PJA71858.1 MAG: hypothetical protein CO152_04550 [bacterium CG_4_9_14_3_um_filter_33_26]